MGGANSTPQAMPTVSSELRGVIGALRDAWSVAKTGLLGIAVVTVLSGLLAPLSAGLLQRLLNGLTGPLPRSFWLLVSGLLVVTLLTSVLPLILRMLQGDLARSISLHNTDSLLREAQSPAGSRRIRVTGISGPASHGARGLPDGAGPVGLIIDGVRSRSLQRLSSQFCWRSTPCWPDLPWLVRYLC